MAVTRQLRNAVLHSDPRVVEVIGVFHVELLRDA